ncbi:hypothetical protein J6590_030642 [Homalodisca vitripennis]|nr:hypothetical protein J6590_030642 [Homalodisca vitripennis]
MDVSLGVLKSTLVALSGVVRADVCLLCRGVSCVLVKKPATSVLGQEVLNRQGRRRRSTCHQSERSKVVSVFQTWQRLKSGLG